MSRPETAARPTPLAMPLIETARRADAGLVGWRLDRLRQALAGPLCIVGAGGSRAVAMLWAALHRMTGAPATTPSPLALRSDRPTTPVLILSGSGRHHDILGAAEAALAAGVAVHGVCTSAEAPLLDRLRRADPGLQTVALDGPTVREGLAARHALVPAALLAGRVHGLDGLDAVDAFARVDGEVERAETLAAARPGDVVVLGAGRARGAAEIFAHLLRESGFAPARAADPREFAHGQFVAVRPTTRLVLIGSTAQPWLPPFSAALPDGQTTRIVDDRDGVLGALGLFARALNCAGETMAAAGATPGREAIPDWGAKLYRMPVPDA